MHDSPDTCIFMAPRSISRYLLCLRLGPLVKGSFTILSSSVYSLVMIMDIATHYSYQSLNLTAASFVPAVYIILVLLHPDVSPIAYIHYWYSKYTVYVCAAAIFH